jgi:hypothetical protein
MRLSLIRKVVDIVYRCVKISLVFIDMAAVRPAACGDVAFTFYFLFKKVGLTSHRFQWI